MWRDVWQWAIPTFCGGLLTLCIAGFKKVLNNLSDFRCALEDSKKIDKIVLKKSISETHQRVMAQRYISRYDLEIVEEEFERYKELHGNSFIHKMMEDIRILDII